MSELITDRYWPIARDKPGLLIAMMRALAGEAHISFEGNLQACTFPPDIGGSPDETAVLRRHTRWPQQDFLVFPLEPTTIRPIFDTILPHKRHLKDIIHI